MEKGESRDLTIRSISSVANGDESLTDPSGPNAATLPEQPIENLPGGDPEGIENPQEPLVEDTEMAVAEVPADGDNNHPADRRPRPGLGPIPQKGANGLHFGPEVYLPDPSRGYAALFDQTAVNKLTWLPGMCIRCGCIKYNSSGSHDYKEDVCEHPCRVCASINAHIGEVCSRIYASVNWWKKRLPSGYLPTKVYIKPTDEKRKVLVREFGLEEFSSDRWPWTQENRPGHIICLENISGGCAPLSAQPPPQPSSNKRRRQEYDVGDTRIFPGTLNLMGPPSSSGHMVMTYHTPSSAYHGGSSQVVALQRENLELKRQMNEQRSSMQATIFEQQSRIMDLENQLRGLSEQLGFNRGRIESSGYQGRGGRGGRGGPAGPGGSGGHGGHLGSGGRGNKRHQGDPGFWF